ncbi:MAG: multiheme c-type cytochrome, partial [bacterium]
MRIQNCIILIFLIPFSCQNSDNPALTPLSERFDPITQSYAYPIPNLEPVPGIIGLKAKDCGVCHLSIYNEWKASTHATALRDIQFQAELAKPDSPKWICLNCHIPMQNQREYIVKHLEERDIFRPVKIENKKFDPEMQQESITCASCHVRPDGKNASIIIGPNGSTQSPHPVRQDRAFLRDMCHRCHNPQGEGLTRNLICWFETTRELAEGQAALKSESSNGSDCVDCHMPEEKRHLADTFTNLPLREVNRHHWTGSGIPKWYPAYDSLLARGYEPGLEVQVGKIEFESRGKLKTTITLKNARAGHYLPTADPERFILALAYLEDKDGNRQQVEKLRIGQQWLWNPARKVGDNRLKQGETFGWDVSLLLPEQKDGIKFVVLAYNVRLTSENARHMTMTNGVNENYLPNGQQFVKHIAKYY